MVRAYGWSLKGLAIVGALVGTSAAAVAAGIGYPEPWQIARQVPVTENAADIAHFEVYLHVLAIVISAFVLGLLLWCVYRFARA